METVRTYSLIFSGGDNQVSSIELRDSNNELLECNYVAIEVSGTGAGAARHQEIQVSFDSPNLATPLSNQSVAGNTEGDTSGFTGQSLTAGVTKEFTFSDNDRVSSVRISLSNTSPVYAFFHYGQIQTVNPTRASERQIGN